MNMLFESRYVSDEQWVKEVYRYTCFRRPINLIIVGILAIYSVLILLVLKSPGMLLATVGLVVIRVLIYYFGVKNRIARTKEMYGENVGVIASVFDDCIRYATTSGDNFRIHYTDMKTAEATEHFILIFSKSNVIYTLKKDWFTHGNENDFMNFLRYKGINVK